jgi:hypothetical protein
VRAFYRGDLLLASRLRRAFGCLDWSRSARLYRRRMLTARMSTLRLSSFRSVFFLIVLASTGCKIKSSAPYWLEVHGHAVGVRVAGWPSGALLIGSDRHLWEYPGPWSNPWVPQAHTHELRAVAASDSSGYALLSDGEVSRFANGRWRSFEGSQAWGVTEIGATEDDTLLLIARGKLSVFEHGALKELSCDAVTGVAVAGVQGEDAFLLDQSGALYLNSQGKCDRIAAPTPLARIAARPNRLLAVGTDGSLWRRRGGAWGKLAPPFKYRIGQVATATQAQDVGVSAYSSWVVDDEGSVYLLSDET